MLLEMVREPEVAEWWGPYTAGELLEELREVRGWTVVDREGALGWLQAHEEPYPQFPFVAFDISLNRRGRGRGLGQAALRLAIGHFIARGHHRFTIDPAVDNRRAIRCYRAVGFKPVGVLRAQERVPDGSGWRDGLLMDLLAWEFAAVG